MSQNGAENPPPWHTRSVDVALSELSSTWQGLADAEAERRLDRYGPNELQASARISAWKIFFEQFKNVLILILLVATVASAFLGHGVETIVIAIIVLFAVVLALVYAALAGTFFTQAPRLFHDLDQVFDAANANGGIAGILARRAGGFDEVWLARHMNTKEERVFPAKPASKRSTTTGSIRRRDSPSRCSTPATVNR